MLQRFTRWYRATASVVLASSFALGASTALTVAPATTAHAASTGGAVWLTGHDPDYHCLHDAGTGVNSAGASCHYLATAVAYVQQGSTLPILALDSPVSVQSSWGANIMSALTRGGISASSIVEVDPTSAAFATTAFVDGSGNPLYSAIVTESAATYGSTLSARSSDFSAYLNAGGGIVALASNKISGYYSFLPISATAVTVASPFALTAAGTAAGLVDPTPVSASDINCCATHNSFATPAAGSPLQTLETDHNGVPETLAAQGIKISNGHFIGISLSPLSGLAGTTITVTGSGFNAGDTLTATLGTSPTTSLGTCTADGSGNVSSGCTFSVPSGVLAGTYNVTVSDTHGDTVSTPFSLLGPPALSLSPTTGGAGTVVTASSGGFGTNKTLTFTISGSGATIGTCTSTGTGAVPSGCHITVPTSTTPGSYTITVGDGSVTATSPFTVPTASLSLSPTSGIPGDPVSGSGGGFNSGSTLTFTIDTTPVTTLGTCTADSSGNLPSPCNVTVPSTIPAGSYNVTVSDGHGHTATMPYTVISPLPPQAVVGKAGTTFRIKGANFGKSLPTVTFTPASGGSVTTVNTQCSGKGAVGCVKREADKTVTVSAPSGPTGLQKVGISGADAIGFNFYFDYGPAILSISRSGGDAGTTVRIKGGNFGAGLPTVSFGSSTVSAACSKGVKNGCITSHNDKSISVKAPSGPTGLQHISVTTSGGSAADDLTRMGADFGYDGVITAVSPLVGVQGTVVHIKGADFGNSMPTVTFGSAPATVKTHSNTQITVVAPVGSGTVDITVTTSAGVASDESVTGAQFAYAAAVSSMSPLSGKAGTVIRIKGANFGTALPTVTFGSTTVNQSCGKALKTGCIVSHNDKLITLKSPSGSGLQTVTVTIGGTPAENLTGLPLVFDLGAGITGVK